MRKVASLNLSIPLCQGDGTTSALAGCDRPEFRGTYQLSAVPRSSQVLILSLPLPYKGGPKSLAVGGRVSWAPLLGSPPAFPVLGPHPGLLMPPMVANLRTPTLRARLWSTPQSHLCLRLPSLFWLVVPEAS